MGATGRCVVWEGVALVAASQCVGRVGVASVATWLREGVALVAASQCVGRVGVA